jgi:hypothetical protein
MDKDKPEAPETSVGIESGASALPVSLVDTDSKAISGRIETGLKHRFNWFDAEKKSRFLELAKTYWPKLSQIAAAVGVHPSTVWLHRKSDKAFDRALNEINQSICDNMEAKLVEQGLQPKGFLDRISYLRAHRPELYDRAKTIKIETKSMDNDQRSARLRVVSDVVDAEVVGAVKGRRQKRISPSPQKPI